MAIVTLRAQDGSEVRFDEATLISKGGMKDVYFSPDRSYVVAFYRAPLDYAGHERLKAIVGQYRTNIYERDGGDYWKDLMCWPTRIVDHAGRTGIVVPTYHKTFFFKHGSVNGDMLGIKGQEKEGKWFASAKNQFKFIAPEERGDWLRYLQISLAIARSVRRLHAAGLAHSDLSYKNVLVDPTSGKACVIDIDGLVVPGKFPPDVVGTPDFIAPEVVATQHLDRSDPARKLPSTATDRHALAVLVYMYLFYRHPLRGGKVHDPDPTRDEELGMGAKALFVEHPADASNRVRAADLGPAQLPWGDPARMPYTIAGPHLAALFEAAFVDGLHEPAKRPGADQWEQAILKTIDMIQPCSAKCAMGWYVFDNKTRPKCPYCGTAYQGALPVLNFYSSRNGKDFRADNHRLMVWSGQSLSAWHVNRLIHPNEHLRAEHRKRAGYFQLHGGDWFLVNETMTSMKDVAAGQPVPPGGHVKLTDGGQILLSAEEGGRLVQVQLVRG